MNNKLLKYLGYAFIIVPTILLTIFSFELFGMINTIFNWSIIVIITIFMYIGFILIKKSKVDQIW